MSRDLWHFWPPIHRASHERRRVPATAHAWTTLPTIAHRLVTRIEDPHLNCRLAFPRLENPPGLGVGRIEELLALVQVLVQKVQGVRRSQAVSSVRAGEGTEVECSKAGSASAVTPRFRRRAAAVEVRGVSADLGGPCLPPRGGRP